MHKQTALSRMIVLVIACSLAIAAVGQTGVKPDARELVTKALAAMGGEAKLRALKTMQFEAVSHQNMLEQSERPEGPWLVDYREVSELRDLENGWLRRTAKSRSIVSPDGRPLTMVISRNAAAMEFGGRFFPAPPSELQDAAENLALMPERVLLNALAAADLRLEKSATLQGVNQHVVAFTHQGKTFRVFLNINTVLPTAAEIVSDFPDHMFWQLWGDTTTRVAYSTWVIETGGIRYPHQFDFTRQELPYQSLTITKLTINPALTAEQFNIPTDVIEAFGKSRVAINDLPLGWRGRGQAAELASGVVKIPAGWDVAMVRQSDGVVIIEAPISPGYSGKVLAEAERRFPGVPVKVVVTTSDAWPHIGGIREYVARGITIYVLDLNRPLLGRVIAAPHQTHPDALAKTPRKANFQIVAGKTTIGTGANRLELYPIRGESSERMLMVYFPEHGLLYGSDLIQKSGKNYFMPQYLSELMDAVTREKLAVKSVFAMHAPLTPWQEITDTVTKLLAGSN